MEQIVQDGIQRMKIHLISITTITQQPTCLPISTSNYHYHTESSDSQPKISRCKIIKTLAVCLGIDYLFHRQIADMPLCIRRNRYIWKWHL
jgi:hypothetical protein